MRSREQLSGICAWRLVLTKAGGEYREPSFDTLRASPALLGGHGEVAHARTTARHRDQVSTALSGNTGNDGPPGSGAEEKDCKSTAILRSGLGQEG